MAKLDVRTMALNPNIANDLDEKYLEEWASELLEGFELDMDSRKDWEDSYKESMKLALQIEEEKSYPWENAANVKYPLLTIASTQFSSRALSALIPGTDVVRGKVNGFDASGEKRDAAIRVGKHMSYQLLEEMDGWVEDMDRLISQLPIVGCAFKKTYFSDVRQTNVSELVNAKNLIVNYWTKDLETSPRITEIIELSSNDIYERVARGVFLDIDLEDTHTRASEDVISIEEDTGQSKPSRDDTTTPSQFLEMHVFRDLDEDGYQEPYVVTIHRVTEQIARVAPRYDEELIELDGQGKVLRIDPIEFYTKYEFVPNPDGGFYGIGLGHLLGPINKSANTAINQLLDSASMSTLGAGMMSKGIRIKGGNKPFRPGEWKQVMSTGDDLRKGIVPLPIREPSAVMLNLLTMLIDGGQKIASVSDMMMGENPGQNQPATTTMAVLEQSTKVFNSIHMRQHRSMKREFKKLHRLNRLYLPDEVYFNVLDMGEEQAMAIGQSDYNLDVTDVTPYSDPSVSSQAQKLIKAQQTLELAQMGTVNMQEATRRVLEAGEQPGIEVLMQLPPPQPDPQILIEQEKLEQEWERIAIEKAKLGLDADTMLFDQEQRMLDSDREDDRLDIEAEEKLLNVNNERGVS